MSAALGAQVDKRPIPSRVAALPLAIAMIASVVLAVAALLTRAAGWYPSALIAAVAIGAGWIAVVDARTRTLPNRLVGAFAAAAAVQAVAVAAARAEWEPIAWAAASAAAAGVLYLLMGLAGWVGFGDVKFAPALAVAVAAAAGGAALWLTPIAIVFAGAWLLIRKLAGDSSRRQAHGPALAAAAVALMIAGVIWPV